MALPEVQRQAVCSRVTLQLSQPWDSVRYGLDSKLNKEARAPLAAGQRAARAAVEAAECGKP